MVDSNIIKELVGGDIESDGNDRNPVSNSEIETGPVDKSFDDTSDYGKGVSTTTDRASRYRQDLPWFVGYGQTIPRRTIRETKEVLTKTELEEKIISKSEKNNDLFDKDFDKSLNDITNKLENSNFTEKQLESVKEILLKKIKDAKL